MANQNGGDAAQPQQQPWSGITPTPSPVATPVPGGDPPDARSPNAKRPLNRESIAMSTSETTVLSNEDLSAGMNTLYMNQERDRKWSTSIAESVHHNAEMLNAAIHRLNGLEAACGVPLAAAGPRLLLPTRTKLAGCGHSGPE